MSSLANLPVASPVTSLKSSPSRSSTQINQLGVGSPNIDPSYLQTKRSSSSKVISAEEIAAIKTRDRIKNQMGNLA